MSVKHAVRTAVVGLSMGRAHAYAYNDAERADLRWVVDLNQSLAQEVAAELGCGHASNLEDVLGDVDAVSLCVPHHLHAPLSLQALAAGKHVLVEKPMANTEAECLDMIRVADEQNLKLMVAFPLRFRPAYRRLKQAIEHKEFGRVISVNGFVHSFLTPRPGSWFARKDQLGGGVLFSHGCHDIDIMIWLMGMPRRSAYVSTRVGTEWMEGEGTAQCVFEFEGGAVGNLSATWGFPFKNQKARIQVHTTEALIETSGNALVVHDKDGQRTLTESAPGRARRPGDGVIDEIEHFLSAITNDTTPLTDGREAMKSLRVVWDLYAGDSRS